MSVVLPRLRHVLGDLAAHHPPAVSDVVHPLANNESPFAPLPSVVAAIVDAVTTINRYPDGTAGALTAEIADWLRVGTDQVVVGAGSVALLQMVFEAVGEPGAEVVYAWRSFEAFPKLAALAGMRAVPVPLREERHDLDAMAAALTPATRLVIVCNPNNPTGTAVGRAQLEDFLDRVPADCLVVLDEAYHEYVRDPEVPDGLTLARSRPNVVVVRTFSKAFGLAGLRIGYLVADPAVAADLRKTRLPFSVIDLAQVAASASLRAREELLARVEETVKERERVREALLDAGWPVAPSEANFVWLPLGEDSVSFAATCATHGVHVRAFPGDGVRVTIGDRAANDAFLVAADKHRRSS